MKHPEEKTIELYYLEAESVGPHRREIAKHLRSCRLCKAVYRTIRQYYREADIGNLPAMVHPAHGYDRKALPPLAGRNVSTVAIGLQTRLALSFRLHPVGWSAGMAAILVVGILAVARIAPGNENPDYARPEQGALVVYNSHAEELWRKNIGQLLQNNEVESYLISDGSYGAPVKDVDGDGRNEVFCVFGWRGPISLGFPGADWRNVLVCFNADGSERWRYTLRRDVTVGSVRFSDDWRFYQIRVGDFDRNGVFNVYGFASHVPWYPNVIVRLDARTGELLSEYWHNGMLPWVQVRDLDDDGIEEMITAGQNNRFSAACLAVLDPRRVQGHAPAPPDAIPSGISPASEKAYILFPASDLKPFWGDITNEVVGLSWKADSTLEVVVMERINSPFADSSVVQGTLYYYFDQSMRCVQVRAADAFSAIRSKYEAKGYVRGGIDSRYLENLRSRVQYWNGRKFVANPVLGRRN